MFGTELANSGLYVYFEPLGCVCVIFGLKKMLVANRLC